MTTLTATQQQPNCYCHSHPIGTDRFAWEHGCHDVRLLISQESQQKLRDIPRGQGHIMEGIIAFDRISHKYWAIRHFPCWTDSFDCCCAAQAQEVSGPDVEVEWEDIQFPEEEDECPCCGSPLH